MIVGRAEGFHASGILDRRIVGAVALAEFRVAGGRAAKSVVAADHVQGEKGDAAEIPARVLAVFFKFPVAAAALPGERDGALAETLVAVEEQAAQFAQSLQRIA